MVDSAREAVSDGRSLTQRNEQSGGASLAVGLVEAVDELSLAVGLVSGVRNVTTHSDFYPLSEDEAYEWLALISVMRRRLDGADHVPPPRRTLPDTDAPEDEFG